MRLAINARRELVHDTETSSWRLSYASLVNLSEGCWYWEITFDSYPKRGGSTGVPPDLRLIVTMDGKVLDPKVSDAHDVTDEPAK